MKKLCILIFFSFFFSTLTFDVAAQSGVENPKSIQNKKAKSPADYIYDKDLLTKEFHRGRREAVRAELPDGSAAVFFTNPVRNRANDVNFPFHPDPNFYYLTGYTEPNAVLIIYKEMQQLKDGKTDEIIFVQDRNPDREVWDGRRLGTQGTESVLGINAALPNTEFAEYDLKFQDLETVLITPLPKGAVDSRYESTGLYKMIESFKTNSGENVDNLELSKIMSRLRQIKTPEELVLMRKAIDITCEAQKELMRTLNPSMTEYQAQALVEFVFMKNGARGPGFPSIVGAGENSCILHYTTNRKPLTASELMVVDIGAEYHGYTADVSRTMPVNGKFSSEQKQIYELVQRAQQAGIEVCRPGAHFRDPHKVAIEIITKGLKDLGIIKEDKDVRKYFMHGTSHYLGLDVHDPGTYELLEENMVITVEPGIYIAEGSDCDPKWWNIGVRIEDDILITATGYENLSACVPRDIDEIEKLMQEKGKYTIGD
jgi:Xaa-Pro aminopeptidase